MVAILNSLAAYNLVDYVLTPYREQNMLGAPFLFVLTFVSTRLFIKKLMAPLNMAFPIAGQSDEVIQAEVGVFLSLWYSLCRLY